MSDENRKIYYCFLDGNSLIRSESLLMYVCPKPSCAAKYTMQFFEHLEEAVKDLALNWKEQVVELQRTTSS